MHWYNKNLWLYLIIYVGLVFGFAIAYTLLPDHFYSSTLQYEPETLNLKMMVQHQLQTVLLNNIDPGSQIPVKDKWKINGLYIDDFSVKPKFIIAKIKLHSESCCDDDGENVGINAIFNLNISTSYYENEVIVRECEVSDIVLDNYNTQSKAQLDISKLFLSKTRPSESCIEIPNNIDINLVALNSMLNGHPPSGKSQALNHFLRMLYFSAVTISTVGYGDVVPLTRFARTIVTLEVFMGPLLLGFFLAAVGARMGKAEGMGCSGGGSP